MFMRLILMLTKKLVSFIEERLTKLEKFYDKVVASDAFLKVENTK